MPTHYDILEVGPEASVEDIRRAYRRLSKKYHPDVNSGAPWSAERFREIHRAYRELMDVRQSRVHERKVKSRSRPAPASSTASNGWSEKAQSGSHRSQRPRYRSRSNPYAFYFLLMGISLSLFVGRLWLSPNRTGDAPATVAADFHPPATNSSQEAFEFLAFYKEYPQLISPAEAQTVFSTSIPEGFTDLLKFYLSEGDMTAFRALLHQPNGAL